MPSRQSQLLTKSQRLQILSAWKVCFYLLWLQQHDSSPLTNRNVHTWVKTTFKWQQGWGQNLYVMSESSDRTIRVPATIVLILFNQFGVPAGFITQKWRGTGELICVNVDFDALSLCSKFQLSAGSNLKLYLIFCPQGTMDRRSPSEVETRRPAPSRMTSLVDGCRTPRSRRNEKEKFWP